MKFVSITLIVLALTTGLALWAAIIHTLYALFMGLLS